MKRTFIITTIVLLVSIVSLAVFNKLASKKRDSVNLTQVAQGKFEITVSATGELMAEKSMDILVPEIVQQGNQRGGGGDIRASMMRIQDLIPEGTIVKPGDFIAQLDKSEYDNTLKDGRERLTTLQTQLEMKILDSAVVLNSLRDEIKNQKFLIVEAQMKLHNSKYESPDIIRQAEIALDKAVRTLEQKERYYTLRKAQTLQDIRNTQWFISRVTSRVQGTEALIAKFTITAPSEGMVIYKRDMRGQKRKIGSIVSPFDRVVATIPDLSVMMSRTFVSEIEVSKVKAGQKVNIVIDAFPKKSYTGTVISIANIGGVLPNSDSKVFETLIRIDGYDPALRPSMTTSNKIFIKTMDNVTYVPIECIQAGSDSIPFVYTKNQIKQIVVPGEANEKNIVIEQGLKPGTSVYVMEPENHEKFKLSGQELIPIIKERNKAKIARADI
jgi:HlyD family secretion protein